MRNSLLTSPLAHFSQNHEYFGKVPGVAAKSGSSGAAQTVTATNFAASVMVLLKEMLQVFKQKESAVYSPAVVGCVRSPL
jgi:hypothetical protein